jgi:hypothetical protein
MFLAAVLFPILLSGCSSRDSSIPGVSAADSTRGAFFARRLAANSVNTQAVPPAALAKWKALIATVPSGSKVYVLPGLVVDSGSSNAIFDRADFRIENGLYVITRKGKDIAQFPLSAKITRVSAALTYYVKPGNKIPKAVAGLQPVDVVP